MLAALVGVAPEIVLPVGVVVGREGVEAPHKRKRRMREDHAEFADSSREQNPPAVAGAPESVDRRGAKGADLRSEGLEGLALLSG